MGHLQFTHCNTGVSIALWATPELDRATEQKRGYNNNNDIIITTFCFKKIKTTHVNNG
jgi:hypothetical protein